jgi:glycyl-tRNA synthetase beta chain
VETAARYAKADLVSGMVQEFPVLQGQMGGRYAAAAGMPPEVAQAIAEHYLPLSAVAPVPASLAGAVVAIADKADNIAGAWLAGERPSGSRDPYGLRRAAMGIVRIALEFSLRIGVPALVDLAVRGYIDQGILPSTVSGTNPEGEMAEFIRERLAALLLDEGLPFALVEAALGSSAADVPALAARARTFAALEGRPHFVDVVTAYNRCAPLVAKAGVEPGAAAGEALFSTPAEADLRDALNAVDGPVREQLDHLEIASALAAAAALRPAVDRFFDEVLVMDPDPAIRANRLAQLSQVTGLLGMLGDFGRLPVQQGG